MRWRTTQRAGSAEAERLFVEGQAAFNKNDQATGCALMRKSLGLFAVANSLFNVARCEEADGKLLSAYEHWKRGLPLLDSTDKRTPVVKKSIEALEARLPQVRIMVPPKWQPLVVLLDGEEVALDKLEAPVLVDPGKHTIVARKAGRQDKSTDISLNEKERTEVVAEPGDVVVKAGPSTSGAPPSGKNGLKTGGFVALGIGAASVVGAIVTGGLVVSKQSEIDPLCPDFHCTQAGLDAVKAREPLVLANAVLWGVGIAGIGAGAVMLILAPKKGNEKATVVPLVLHGGSGIGLSGRF